MSSPLVSLAGDLDNTLATIGGRHNKTAAQIALRLLVHREHVVTIMKATSREHLVATLPSSTSN